jgi:hypothetical protein
MISDDERPDPPAQDDWDAFERRFRAEYDATPPGPPHAVTARLAMEAARRRRRRGGWLGGGILAAAAAAAAVVAVGLRDGATDEARPRPPAHASLQVALVAPGASRVSVVGDFNEWDPNASPLARSADGSWRARIPVPPGRHEYAFVVDDGRWVTDPVAPRAPDLGWGRPNSVALVAAVHE